MVKVCDSIMGAGKSSAAITYINEHPGEKFIYITPYLDEAARIKKGCPGARFIEPSDKLKQYQFKKYLHTAALIADGRNIATTHQAFKSYTPDMLDDIRTQGYTLIIDENVDVLENYDIPADDLQLAIDAGYIKEENGTYSIVNHDYHGKALHDLFWMMRSRELIRIDDKSQTLFYWVLPQELILSFKDVYILTYLFEGQSIHHFLEIYDIPYEFVNIAHDSEGAFRFCDGEGYTPEYVTNLKDMIHVMDNPKLNAIGEEKYALSMTWFESNPVGVEQLRKNIHNCYRHVWEGVAVDKRLWGSYKSAFQKLRGKGYWNSFLPFNAKATNDYKNRPSLPYLLNKIEL